MKQKTQKETEKMLLYLPKKIADKVREEAQANYRTISGEVAWILEQQYKTGNASK
jgi:hypothetical protein